MKKVLALTAFAILTLTAIGCEPEDLTNGEYQEQATGKGCDGSPGDKDGCPEN